MLIRNKVVCHHARLRCGDIIPVCPSHPWSVVQDGRRVLFFSCTQEAVLGGHLLGLPDELAVGHLCGEWTPPLMTPEEAQGSTSPLRFLRSTNATSAISTTATRTTMSIRIHSQSSCLADFVVPDASFESGDSFPPTSTALTT